MKLKHLSIRVSNTYKCNRDNDLPCCSCCPTHSHITHMYRKSFSRVCKGNRSFARTVEALKEVHAGSHHSDFGLGISEPKAEASPQQCQAEEGKSG